MLLPLLKIIITMLIGFGLGLLTASSRRSKPNSPANPEHDYPPISQPQHILEPPISEAIAPNPPLPETFHPQEIEALQTEIQVLKQQNQELEIARANLSSQYQEASQTLTITQQQLGETKNELSVKQREIDEFLEEFTLDNERQKLQGKIDVLKQNLDDSQNFIQHLKAKTEKLTQENEFKQEENQYLYEENRQLRSHKFNGIELIEEEDFILNSTDRDLYQQEKKNIILKLLQVAFNNTNRVKTPRRYDILKNILEHNQPTNYEEDLSAKLSAIFASSKHQKQALEGLGFTSSKGKQKKHNKVLFQGV